jgi:3-hydroxybutyryl-CoA dehydrogenase
VYEVRPVGTVSIIGAGKAGRSIALAAATGGYQVVLEDLLPNALRRAESELHTSIDESVKAGKVSADVGAAALSRLEFAGSVEEAARQADLVIEAGPEELESKIEIFTLLDKICRPGTMLVSVLGSLSISEISHVTYRARQCVGLRISHGIAGQRVQIIRSSETDNDTVIAVTEMVKRMGAAAAVVDDDVSGRGIVSEPS